MQTIYLKDYQQPSFWIDNVKLKFDLRDDQTRVTSIIDFVRNPTQGKDKPLVLLGESLKLIEIKLNDKSLNDKDYQLSADKLTLTIHHLPDVGTLQIVTEIYPDKNTELSGLYWAKNLYCTQCEAEGFRRITYYLDRPDVMASFETRIEADKKKYPVLLSNGNCVESGQIDEHRHYVIWRDPFKKPSYLFALVAGDLVSLTDHYLTKSNRLVTLKIFVERENQDKCQHAMEALKKSMRWDEETYGREYDLDIYMIVATNDFNMGAMENKGLNIFNSKYILARPETATDRDYQLIDAVVGHEYFHNWTGNRITCRDWFQLSLKEGLTVFREHQFNADITESPISLIENVRMLRTSQFTEDSGPLAHPVRPDSYVEINNFYTATVYEKGAEVIRMLKTLIGLEAFRKGMDIYFKKYDGQAVTTDEFVASMSEASNMDLTQFKLWYTQAGTPEISIKESFDANNQVYRLTLTQHCKATPNQNSKLPMHIPIAIGLLDSVTGKDLLSEKTKILQLTQKEQTFEFKNLKGNKPILSILRGFSAPVKIKSDLSIAELAFLLQHDSDDFSRWDAGQQFVERFILQRYQHTLIKQSQSNLNNAIQNDIEGLWINAMQSLLKNQQVHPALKAELLSLPSLSYLIELLDSVNIDILQDALNYAKHTLIKSCAPLFSQIYQQNISNEPYAYTPGQTAKRYLKNTALRYLTDGKLCLEQWQHAHNMTDSFAAVAAISDKDCPERTHLLDAFYERWQHDTNVLDKWFRVQASSEISNALEVVKSLTKHPAFSIKNPNKVYSLLNAFVMSNPAFHHISGEGYQFIADKILELDPLNPQVAARLLKGFSNWKKLDKTRQQMISKELLRIKNTPNISKDVYEVADKSLL